MRLNFFPNECPGKLITFCGLDGCGKTTQINKLKYWLQEQGFAVYLTKQPTDFVRQSTIFRTYMDKPDHTGYDYRALSLLCAADRVQHSNGIITDKLKEGYIVISDRYFYSCIANLIARGYEEDKWIYEIAASIRQPDIAFFLDLSVEEALSRVRKRPEEKERYIDLSLQYRLHDKYLKLAEENGGIVIPTHVSEDICFEEIKTEVAKILPL